MNRIIQLAKPVSRSTFDSIISPCMDSIVDIVSSLRNHLPTLISQYVPDIRAIPLKQGMSWDLEIASQ